MGLACGSESGKTRRRWRSKPLVILLALAVFLPLIGSTTALAWKMKTHAYSGNLVLEAVQAGGGQIEIPPYGKFSVPGDYLRAVQAFPAAYRAGCIGPDGYPDMYVGQAFIHPTKDEGRGTYTDQWLRDLWYDVQNMPEGAAKQEGLAFALGVLTHSAGDVFGHDYINQLSKGVFPAIGDAAKNPDLMKIIARHNITEAFIDSQVPSRYVVPNSDYMKIQAPTQVVTNAWLTNGGVASGYNNLFANFSGAPYHLKAFFETRRLVQEKIDKLGNPPILSLDYWELRYCLEWRKDIDEGISDWVPHNQVAAQAILVSDWAGAKDSIVLWAREHALKMAGSPDVFADAANWIAKLLGDFSRFIEGIVPASVRDEMARFQERFIYDTISNAAFGKPWATVESLSTDPITWLDNGREFDGDTHLFPDGIRWQMVDYMGNFWQDTAGPSGTNFPPFHNTVIMAKLVMIGPDGVNQLMRRAGYSEDLVAQGSNVMLGWVQSLDGSESWRDAALFNGRNYSLGKAPLYERRDIWSQIFIGPGCDGYRIGAVVDGVLYVKEGGLNAQWVQETANVASFQLLGDRIAALNRTGDLYVKEGGLSAGWEKVASNVSAFQLDGDRIGVVIKGVLYVKEGSLSAAWVEETSGVKSFQLCGDRIASLANDGTVWVKEGALNAGWSEESHRVTAMQLTGDRIGVVIDGVLHVKEGPLNALWAEETSGVKNFQLCGDRIASLANDGTVWVKEGALNAEWSEESHSVTAMQLSGDRIGVVINGVLHVKEGPLNAYWAEETSGVKNFQLCGDRIASLANDGTVWVKEGPLNAQWSEETHKAAAMQLSTATHGATPDIPATTEKPTYTCRLTASAPSRVYRNRSFRLSGSITPTAAPGKVKVTFKRYRSGAWRTVGSVKYLGITRGKYAYTYRPAYRGSWRAYISYSGSSTVSGVFRAAPTIQKAFTVK